MSVTRAINQTTLSGLLGRGRLVALSIFIGVLLGPISASAATWQSIGKPSGNVTPGNGQRGYLDVDPATGDIYAMTQDDGIQRWTGTNWALIGNQSQSEGLQSNTVQTFAIDPLTGYFYASASYSNGYTIYRSMNKGTNWIIADPTLASVEIWVNINFSGSNIYAAGGWEPDGSTVAYHSVDEGLHFARTENPLGPSPRPGNGALLSTVCVPDPWGNLWAGNEGEVNHTFSSDGGATWTDLGFPSNNHQSQGWDFMFDESNGYVFAAGGIENPVGPSYGIYRTTFDQSFDPNNPNWIGVNTSPSYAIERDENGIMYSGGQGGVKRSDDLHGLTWSGWNSGLPAPTGKVVDIVTGGDGHLYCMMTGVSGVGDGTVYKTVAPVNIVGAPANTNSAGWIAYNDNAWSSGQLSTNITRFSFVDDFEHDLSGQLVKYADGQTSGVVVTFAGLPSAAYWVTTNISTPADLLFSGKVDMNRTLYFSGGTETGTITFAGMDPSRRYHIAMLGNRANPAYTNRVTILTIAGAESFSNSSTPGASISGASNMTTTITT